MKIIDLLQRIANGEEVPKKIKVGSDLWNYDDDIDYKAEDDRGYLFEVYTRLNKDDLNEEVEIIEEKKIPEKLEDYDFDESLDVNTKCECLRERMQEIENQLDEIIDFLKQN